MNLSNYAIIPRRHTPSFQRCMMSYDVVSMLKRRLVSTGKTLHAEPEKRLLSIIINKDLKAHSQV